MKKLTMPGLLPIFCLLVSLTGTGLYAQTDLQTVATVKLTKTEPITVKELKNEIEPIEKATGEKLTPAQRRDVLDGMINQRLALQAADRDRITVSENEINLQIDEFRARMAQSLGRRPTDTEFAAAVKEQSGMDLGAFRAQARKMLTVQKYLEMRKPDALRQPTNAEIEKEYNEMKSQAEGVRQLTQDETLQFAAILFPYDRDSDKAKAHSAADALAKEINGSVAKFDEKLNQSSADYQATPAGIIQKNRQALGQVGQAFLDAAFALKYDPKTGATEVSRVLEIPVGEVKGYYIIKPTTKYPFKSPLGLDDMMLQARRPVREFIRLLLMQQKQQQAQEELITELRKGNPFTVNDQYLNF
jgi:chorismate mutase